MPKYEAVLTLATMNRPLRDAEYAVRGAIPKRALDISLELQKDPASKPFTEVVQCNIGNPQALLQKPITFFRQVCALLEYDGLLSDEKASVVAQLFPADAIARAKTLKASIPSTGAYTDSQGIRHIRQNVADFITKRDGHTGNPDDIFITNGASEAVKYILNCLIQNKNTGVMIPIPQYPLYSASMALFDGTPVPYYLDEAAGWGLSQKELARALSEARAAGADVRALCIINPGNPTGQCLSEENIVEIIKFARQERLILLADEVYQTNSYTDKLPFTSFKKVLRDLGPDYDDVEMFSFHSVSKGFVGECGKRGGYMEICGVQQSVREQIYKAASLSLCSNVQGQVMVDLMVNPPKPGDASYALYDEETRTIFESLIRRAKVLVTCFNELEGVTCNNADGAMYTFPKISLPAKAIEAAVAKGMSPDAMYCMEMLEETGVCTVPGSGFQQEPGTFHLRCTFLPHESKFEDFTGRIKKFHAGFMANYK